MSQKNTSAFLFDKRNYLLMILGVVFIFLGFFLMVGGGLELGPDGYQHEFNAEEKYSFRRITLAPILIMIGFVIEGIAIMLKPTTQPNQESR